MEVPCYPEHVISDFSQRIDRLRGEYKAYLRKLRDLCPEETQTPWTDRPYSAKRRKPSEQMGRGKIHFLTYIYKSGINYIIL